MVRPIVKLGAAISSVIPLQAGCNNTPEVPQVPHNSVRFTSEDVDDYLQVISFTKDRATGKISISVSENKKDVFKKLDAKGVETALLSDMDEFVSKFNERKALEQKVISIRDLKAQKPLSQNKVEQDFKLDFTCSCMSPFSSLLDQGRVGNLYYSPKAIPLLTVVPSTSAWEKTIGFPLSLQLKETKFIPESLEVKNFERSVDETVEEGLYFEVEETSNKRRTGVVVEMKNLPLIIDAGDKLYIVGLDKSPLYKGDK